MLLKMIPEQVSEQWEFFSMAINEALPPTVDNNEGTLNKLLAAVLFNKLEVWLSFFKKDEQRITDGVVSTYIMRDEIDQSNILVIYSLYALPRMMSRTSVNEILDALIKYGKSRNCSGILAYTQTEIFNKTIEKFGGRTDFKVLMVPLV